MAGKLIAFPGVTIEPRKTPIRTKRQRDLDKLVEQAKAGDVGAEAEINVVILRDWIVRSQPAHRWPIDYCNVALGDIRKLRRQLEGLGK
jgi:hypothetical protein